MRTSRSKLGEIIVEKLKEAPRTKMRVILPLQGFSGIDKEQGPFRDAEADGALLAALSGLKCSVEELDVHINDPSFALMIATALHGLLQAEGFGRWIMISVGEIAMTISTSGIPV
jgi:uncharacterized protein (UPF0261 family)